MSPAGKYFAIAHAARVVAIKREGEIDLVALDEPSACTRVPISDVREFAAVGGELWTLSGEVLRRFSIRSGTELGTSTQLPSSDGRLLTAPEGGPAAVWRSSDECLLLSSEGDRVSSQRLVPELAGAECLAFLGGRRIVCGIAGAVSIRDLGRGEVASYRMGGRLCTTAAILGGRALAMVVTSDGGGHVNVMLSGKLVHNIDVPSPDLVAIAHRRGLVAVYGDDSLVIVDARLGRVTAALKPPLPLIDLAVDADAGHILLAGMKDTELEVLDFPYEATAWTGPEAISESSGEPPVATSSGTASLERIQEQPLEDIAAPKIAFRRFEIRSPVESAEPGSEAATALLEQAMCHAALLVERLHFLNRNLGLLPRTTTEDDPLGPMVISDSDVSTILAGFRKIRTTRPEERRSLLSDPFLGQITESRASLRQALSSAQVAEVGLARIVHAFPLGDAALDLLVLTLAPDWDLRLGRLFGFLNNDATQQRPRLGHLLMTAQQGLPSLDADVFALLKRELIAPGLVELDQGSPDAPFRSRTVRPLELLVELSTRTRLRARFDAKRWDQLRWDADEREGVRSALRRELHREGQRRLIVLEGPPGSGRMAMACGTALEVGTGFEPCVLMLSERDEITQMERQLMRTAYRARLVGAVLVVRGDHILSKWPKFFDFLQELVNRLDLGCFVTVRTGELASASEYVRFVRFEPPRLTPVDRRQLWQETLEERGLLASGSTLDDITGRYAVTPGRLLELAEELRLRQAWRKTAIVEVGDVRETLRDVTIQKLGKAAKRYRSSLRLTDLILPPSVRDRLAELVHRLRHRQRVLGGWAFADKTHESYGVSSLFSGPAGTGKTAAAVAVANELEIDLYIVDFSGVMSKWVGETEQNLARIFDEAEASSVALLFDEADALFGKRSSEQRSSNDRYANLTVNYLLQRMESYSGLAILTTNLESAMDEAFQRRITTRVKFPPADDAQRAQLWRHLLPPGAKYADDVDLRGLSRLVRMEGAHIRRALTRAAFRAAARGDRSPILTQADLLWAANAEYEDMGRLAFDEKGSPFDATAEDQAHS